MKTCKQCKQRVSGSHYCNSLGRRVSYDDSTMMIGTMYATGMFDSGHSYSSSSSCDSSSSYDSGSSFDSGGSCGGGGE